MGSHQPKPHLIVVRNVQREVSVTIIRTSAVSGMMRHKLVVDGVDIGMPLQRFDWVSEGRKRNRTDRLYTFPESYPKSVRVVTVHLSSGQRVLLASEEIPYLTAAQLRQRDRSAPIDELTPEVYCPTRAKIGERWYSFQQAVNLQPGTVVEWEQPFRLDLTRRVVTNGEVSIPLQRPSGRQEWNRWPRIAPLQGITEANWALMLEVVVGLYLDEVLDSESLKDHLAKEQRRRREQEYVGQHVARLLQGQCFDGESARRVSIGENFVFSLELQGGGWIHLVDSPEYGRGLYVFDTYEDAQAWARRAIDRVEARRKAKAFIPHIDGWRERLSQVLGHVADECGNG